MLVLSQRWVQRISKHKERGLPLPDQNGQTADGFLGPWDHVHPCHPISQFHHFSQHFATLSAFPQELSMSGANFTDAGLAALKLKDSLRCGMALLALDVPPNPAGKGILSILFISQLAH